MNIITGLLKRTILAAAIFAILGATMGCRNTAHGFGKDMENAGETIQKKTD